MSIRIHKVAYQTVWDASALTKGMLTSRQQFAQHKKIVEESRAPFDRLQIGMGNLARLIQKFPELQKQRIALEKQLERQYLEGEAAIRKLDAAERKRLNSLLTADEKEAKVAANRERRLAKLQRSAQYAGPGAGGGGYVDQVGGGAGGSAVGGAMGAGVIAKLGGAALAGAAAYRGTTAMSGLMSTGVDTFREVERVEAALTVFSGSLENSRRMMAEIRDLSAQTGVSFKALSEGVKTMILRDIVPEEAVSMMRKVSIVTGGNADSMRSMALALGQVRQAGRLMGQELIQLVNAGWTPFEEISKKTGIAVADLKKEMEAGRVSYQMVADALDATVSAGGRYYGFLESLEGTTARETDRAAAAWEEAYSRVGAALRPVTSLWQNFSRAVAADIGRLASSLTPDAPPGDGPQQDKAAERRAAAEKAKADMIARQNKEFERQAALQEQHEKSFAAAMENRTFQATMQAMSPEKARETETVYSLLNQHMQERARLELVHNGTAADLTLLLTDQQKIELERLQTLEKQNRATEKQEELTKRAKATAAQYRSEEEKLVDSLAEIELARKQGAMTSDQYDRARRMASADNSLRGGSLASNMQAGSQEAYRFLSGAQDRETRERMAQHKESTALQKATVKALEKLQQILEELEPITAAG